MSIIGIGGLGGSGTRVYAEILKCLGYFIGAELNAEKDNLLFTRLLKDPNWYITARSSDIRNRLTWFADIMSGRQSLPIAEIENAISENLTHPSHMYSIDRHKYQSRDTWAWKEPNSHIYLKYYTKTLPGLKYVLVIRDGLDMALSPNIQQLKNWGKILYNIEYREEDIEARYQAQINYWIAANNAAIKQGRLHLGNNFLVCNYDKLCQQPEVEISKLLRFIGSTPDESLYRQIVALPQVPSSQGRNLKSGYKFSHEIRRKVHLLNAGQPL